MTFRTRLFVASLLVSAATLVVATLLVSSTVKRIVDDRIERDLVNQARLAAETLSHRQAATAAELDAEADTIGRLVSARVTFVAPDGKVVGDSELTADDLVTLDNHGTRPEILQARREGLGIARRYSATLKTDMLYVAVEVHNDAAPSLSEVRLALPLTEISEQLTAVRRSSLVAMSIGLLAALAVAWGASAVLSRRVRSIAERAERYAAGESPPARTDYGTDEIGLVARVLDDSMREIDARAMQRETDRARMEAILNGMNEGVLVVTPQGRLQFVNDAARQMLKVEDRPEGHHYLELARHPDIAPRSMRRCMACLAAAESSHSAATADRHSLRGERRSPLLPAAAPCSCSTTSPNSGGPMNPPRFRRQRLARAADAAYGRARIRRSVARRCVRSSRRATIPGNDRAAHLSNGTAGPRLVAPGQARRGTGAARESRVCHRFALSRRDWRRHLGARGSIAAGRPACRSGCHGRLGRSGEACTMR